MRYERKNILGEGTYGVVFLAQCKTTDKTFAIKRMKAGTSQGIEIPTLRELKFLRELNHPNIISLIDVYSADGYVLNSNMCYVFYKLNIFLKIFTYGHGALSRRP